MPIYITARLMGLRREIISCSFGTCGVDAMLMFRYVVWGSFIQEREDGLEVIADRLLLCLELVTVPEKREVSEV